MIYDVAIIGYGPTGATLANLLAAQGVSVLMIDREAAMYHLPRAVHFDDEVMRVFQTVGIADNLLKRVRVNPGMKFVDDENNLLLDWPRPQEKTLHGWNASYRLHQPDLEELLRNKLALEPSAEIITSFEVTALEDHAGHVTLIGSGADDISRTYKARYVVGCDGANSLTRQEIGGEMDDLGFDERWLVVDVLLNRPRPDLGDHSLQFCNPDRPMTYCRSPGNRRRWEIAVKDSETDAEISDPTRVWQHLSRWITPDEARLERCAVYTFRSQVSKSWRRNHILIAGDAAHLTPPFMGQGMCAGIRDAANLAWKLIACLRGASESLLDTYQAEREPHARAYVETAKRLGGLINALDPASALKMAENDGTDALRMQSIAPKIGESAIIEHQANDGIGRPFNQIDLGNGQRRFDDKVGYRHLILDSNRPALMPKDGLWMHPKAHPLLAAVLSEHKAEAIWVRPDRYIGAISETGANLLEKFAPFLDGKDDQ